MLKVIPPLPIKNDDLITKYLLENNHEPVFNRKHKIYYHLLRPLLPIKLRQFVQKLVLRKIEYNTSFIYPNFINEYLNLSNSTNLPDIFPANIKSIITLTHDVEGIEGLNNIPRVMDLEEKYGFKSSWNIVPYKYKIDEGIIKLIKDAGHEIGIHGYNHDGKLYYSEKIFNERVPYINDAIKRYGAVGFRSPMVHRNLKWLQKLDIQYDASCFDYDPFQPFPGGTGSIWPFIAGKFVELPYTMPQDHTMFYVLEQNDITIWRNKADWIAKNNGVILTLTHPDYLIEKRHFEMYEDLLKYLRTFRNAWYCLPRELSEWWKNKFS